MLILHESNRTEALAGALIGELRAGHASVFEPAWVVVPGSAMRHGLTLRIADALGICANVRMPLLGPFLAELTHRAAPAAAAVQARFEPALLAWRILDALSDAPSWAPHPRLALHLRAADERARLTLASELAELFAHYLAYRPDWLDAWALGQPVPRLQAGPAARDGTAGHALAQDAAWQAALWRRLVAPGPTPTEVAQAFCAAVSDAGSPACAALGLPSCVHVFTPTALAPVQLQMLWALSRSASVHVYALNPCRAHWFDLVDPRRLAQLEARGQAGHHEVGHPLLARWGRQAQGTLGLLHELANDEGALTQEHFVDPGCATLLERLQRSVLELEPLATPPRPPQRADRSVEVHVCHSLTRELEVLHDRLLGLFAEPPPGGALQPWEVLVATPDIEAAAPLVEAVFGTVPAERHIPYTLTGRRNSRSHAAARVLLALLELAASRWHASAVYGVLQQPLVARRFLLDEAGLERVHGWLRDSGARWAADAAHRASLGLPASEAHTFDDALERLYLGLAMPAGACAVVDGRLPAGHAEGSDALALGALDAYLRALQALRAELAVPHEPAQWARLLARTVDDFLDPGPAHADDVLALRAAIATLAERWRLSGLAQPLRGETVRAALAAVLDEPRHGSRPGGGITFAPMSALRHLPHRVVAVIGLADGAYPGADRPAEFDLIAQAPRFGDRQRRLDERNVFLDLVLACRGVLHLSYTGRSVRDNTELPPSPLVSELLDALGPGLVVEHPLQPFSPRHFTPGEDPRLHSFHAEYAQALQARLEAPASGSAGPAQPAEPAEASDDESASDDTTAAPPFFPRPLPEPGAAWRAVRLSQLVAFFRHPSRYLLEQRLQLQLPRERDELEDAEPFRESHAARRALAERLLPPLLGENPPDAAQARALARAGVELPPGAVGEALLEQEWASLQAFATQLRRHLLAPARPPHAVQLNIELDGQPWTLQADFARPHASGLVRWRYDTAHAGDHLEAWITHLAWLAGGVPAGSAARTVWCARGVGLAFAEVADPHARLQALLRLYRSGLSQPLPFFPRSAWALVSQGSRSKALGAWRGRPGAGSGERDDASTRLAWRGRPDPLDHDFATFEALAHQVLDPLRAHLEEA
ncbi:MAG: hypothetical protein RI988_801 [Pseudomonadota bacterium]|jgi:exodeoxyribonuclease V gamma subunit